MFVNNPGYQLTVLLTLIGFSDTKATASSNRKTPIVQPRARVKDAQTALAKRSVSSSGQFSSTPTKKPAAKASPAPDSSIEFTLKESARSSSLSCLAMTPREPCVITTVQRGL